MQEKKTTTINPFNKKFYGKDNGFVGGVIEDFANIKTLKFWKKNNVEEVVKENNAEGPKEDNLNEPANVDDLKDSIKNLAKGVSKSIIIAVPMITVGLLLGPLGPLFAIGGAVVMGAMTPKIASVLGFKGIQKSSEHRSQDRLEKVELKNIQAKQKQLEKAGSYKKILGAIACIVGVVATVLTAGTALPIVFAGGMIIYSGKKDAELAKKVEGINVNSTSEELNKAALDLGFIKQKDLDKLKEQDQKIDNPKKNVVEIAVQTDLVLDKTQIAKDLASINNSWSEKTRSHSVKVENRRSSGLEM